MIECACCARDELLSSGPTPDDVERKNLLLLSRCHAETEATPYCTTVGKRKVAQTIEGRLDFRGGSAAKRH